MPRMTSAPRPSPAPLIRRATLFAETASTAIAATVMAVSAKGVAQRISGAGDGRGALVMRGIEFGAAGLVLLFGIGLLSGYLFAEPLTCLQPIL